MTTKRILLLAAFIAAVALIVIYSESALSVPHCDQCGQAMRPMDNFPSVFECRRCGTKVDTSFQH